MDYHVIKEKIFYVIYLRRQSEISFKAKHKGNVDNKTRHIRIIDIGLSIYF